MRQRKKQKDATSNEGKTTAMQEESFFQCLKYKVKCSKGFLRRDSFGLGKSGWAAGRPGIFR